MGQKVHPTGFRLGYIKTWRSRWYAEKDYASLLHEDLALKKDLKKRFGHAGVSRVEIERAANKLKVTIHTSRPGIIIGRKGQEVDKLKQEVQKRTGKEVFINIQEILKPELDAQLVSESVALQLEKRIAFRRAMRKAVDAALRFGARGIKIRVSGRLNGAEIARSEWYLNGQLPLHTLRADIDYGFHEAPHHVRPDRRQDLDLPGRDRRRAARPGARLGVDAMLMPKKVKFRKQQRGRMSGKAWTGGHLAFGDYGLKATECGWVTAREIEAGRIAITRFIKRSGRIWIRMFPDKPFTKKPQETRMGKGKGAPEGWVMVVKPGRILYEMEGVPETEAREALRLAAHKLSITTRIVTRAEGQ